MQNTTQTIRAYGDKIASAIETVKTGEGDAPRGQYNVICFRKSGRNKVIRRGLSLSDAQAWCSREDTHGKNWFHGFTRA